MNKFLYILIISLLANLSSCGQSDNLYELETKLRQGDKSALLKIAAFFDSEKIIEEFLGHHLLESTEAQIAKRIIQENCLFLNSEIIIGDSTSTKEFQTFLTKQFDSIHWEPLAEAYLITPLQKRTIRAEFQSLSKTKEQELKNNLHNLKKTYWFKDNQFNTLLEAKDSKVLLNITSALFKIRNRFNTYHFNKDEYIQLIQFLTKMEIGVENEQNQITWHLDKEYEPDASLNLLIFFSQNYKDFIWNEQAAYFQKPKIKINPIDRERSLFQRLMNKSDSIAIDAFVQLTNSNSVKVTQLANEYDQMFIGIEENYSIPTFPYRFLKQLVLLTEYCNRKNHEYDSKSIKEYVLKLDAKLSFVERRALENEMIEQLTLEEITSFEYWSLIYQKSDRISHSAGRILDIFYSKNWSELLAQPTQLKLYLKKAYLFDELGIIGTCNNYLIKFINNGSGSSTILKTIQTNDTIIKQQIEEALKLCNISIKRPIDNLKVNEGNKDFRVEHLERKLDSINLIVNPKEKEQELKEVLAEIQYDQIGTALASIEDIPFEHDWNKYAFMRSDWGFLFDNRFNSPSERERFLNLYSTLDEFALYAHLLDRANIQYKHTDSSLHYDKIYEILKYNVVTAFAGGGGGKRDNEVYAIIKILELTHHTTLGYPQKLCNSRGIYGCNTFDRTNEWMHYLKNKGYITIDENEPVSFKYKN